MRKSQLSAFAAFSAIGTVTLMPLLVLPAMIGVLVDNAGMSESAAGWSASVNFLASALIGIAMSLRIHHLNLQQVARWGLMLAIVADIVSGVTAGNAWTFYAARFVSGIGLGAAYVAAAAAFPRHDDYERGYGLFITLQFIVSGIGLYIVPVYADQLGGVGLFGMFAVLEVFALLICTQLPSDRAKDTGTAAGSELTVLISVAAVFGVLGFALFEAANNAQFAYIERFGVALEITDAQIGTSLLIASLLGIPGAFSIVVVGDRFGKLLPIFFGIAIALAGLALLFGARNYAAYFIGGCCMGFSWAFCLPFIQSLLASIDRNGSVIAAGTALSTLGSAFGPGLAAVVVVGGAYGNVFMLSAALFFVMLVMFVIASRGQKAAA